MCQNTKPNQAKKAPKQIPGRLLYTHMSVNVAGWAEKQLGGKDSLGTQDGNHLVNA